MLDDVQRGQLRKDIASRDLSVEIESLWQKCARIHDLQNKQDGTENGRPHVETVEFNMWRLLREIRGRNAGQFKAYGYVLLSASACCHDLDKAAARLDSSMFPGTGDLHGKGSAVFVRMCHERLGFTDSHRAEDVAKIIAVHDLKGEQFEAELREIRHTDATGSHEFNHRMLALILKVADILHTDYTRIVENARVSELDDLGRSKYHARRSIKGWRIDGTKIFITSEIQNDEQKRAIEACEAYMKHKEWPCVKSSLELLDFPSDLQFDIVDARSQKDGVGAEGVSQMPNQTETQAKHNRKHAATTHLKIQHADALLHYSVEPNREQYPMCHDEHPTHMAGVAVGRMVVVAVLDQTKYLKEIFDKTAEDLFNEAVFSPNKLNEHIRCLTELKRPLSLAIDDRSRTPQEGSQNSVLLAFQRIPDGVQTSGEKMKGGASIVADIRSVHTSFAGLLGDLNQENTQIASEIEQLPSGQRAKMMDDKRKYRARIRRLLKETTPNELRRLIKELGVIITDISVLKQALRDDWIADAIVLWKDCAPFEKRECVA